jgi:hypothetical protein
MRYRGHRDANGVCFIEVLDGGAEVARPLSHRVRHSPTGFEWGYEGSGPADTARSILAEHLGAMPHPSVYQAFKRLIVSVMPATWELTDAVIEHYLARILLDLGVRCPRCCDGAIIDGESGSAFAYCACPEGQRARQEVEDAV